MLRYRFLLLVALVMLAVPLCPAAGPEQDGRVNVFIYHRFGESRYPSTNISLDNFRSHLQYLAENKIDVVPLSDVVARLKTGAPLPDSAVAITVDDAFDSFLDEAMPLLRKYDFPVALFVNTDAVGTPGYLDWEQLKSLRAEGVEIGNHSATHDYLLERLPGEEESQWRERVRDDIERAADAFAHHLGFRPQLFAYPYGEYSPELVELVRQLGFDAALAQQSGVVHAGTDRFTLPRFPMGGPYATLQQFRSKAAMHPLVLEVLEPGTPVLGDKDPPELKVRVDGTVYDLGRANAFVQGDNALTVKSVKGEEGVLRLVAEKPLSSRRNKYTLTAPLKNGRGWAWFSQPWFRLDSSRR